MAVKASVYLQNKFKASGEISLPGAIIGGDLVCSNATFENKFGDALFADGMNVTGGVFLQNNFKATGKIRLINATIGGNLDCYNAIFDNGNGVAISADGMRAKGGVFLRDGCTITGSVSLVAASMHGLHLWGGTFTLPDNSGAQRIIDLDAVSVKQHVAFVHQITSGFPAKIEGVVSMRHARIGQIIDSPEVWLPKDNTTQSPAPVALDGCEYQSLGLHEKSYDVEFRKKWLATGAIVTGDDAKSVFAPQPYTQLASVMKKAGHEREAKKILIEREDQRRERMTLVIRERVWLTLIKHTLSYGYESWQMLYYLLLLLIISFFMFWASYHTDNFVAAVPLVYVTSDEVVPLADSDTGKQPVQQRYGPPFTDKNNSELSEYPKFNPFVYSLDTLVPFVNLHQENYWMPTGFIRIWMWIHISLGWVGTTFFVAGFTGIVRRE